MRITRLELENWMGIPRLELDFSAGINLVYGRNEIGKSSIIESIRQAILGDASLKKAEYKSLSPWGRDVKANVRLSFISKGENYRLEKSFPAGNTALYHKGVKVAEDAKKTREKLFQILDISEKTTNLLRLLFINQGESLAIFEKSGKENPLDDNTKSYIKEVIKETAFRELQAFQNEIEKRISQYLPTERKNVKKGTEYYELIEKEKELAKAIDELQQKEVQLQGKMEDIETVDREIHRLRKEAEEKNQYLDVLKKKKERLDELEKKALTFTPVKNDYNAYIKMKSELDEINRRLPELYGARKTRIEEQKKKLGDLEKEKKQSEETYEALKLKKQEMEKIRERTREFEKIGADYKDIKKMESQVLAIQKELPQILSDLLRLQDDELKKISGKLQLRSQTEVELTAIESQLHNQPKITQKEIKDLRKIEDEIGKLIDKINSFREELKLNFRLTPINERKITYTIETGDNQTNTGTTGESLEISGFQKLRFNYPEHFDIHVAGNLAKTDFDALQNDLSTKKDQLSGKLSTYNLATVEELEKKYEEMNEIKGKRDNIRIKLESLEKRLELEKQKKEMIETIESIKQDIRKYVEDNPLPDYTSSEKETNYPSLQSLNQRLIAHKAELNSYQERKNQILEKNRLAFLDLEKEYMRQEKELNKQLESYRGLEPRAIETVTDKHLENAISETNTVDKKIVVYQNEIKLLEEMGPMPPEYEDDWEQLRQTSLTSQQLRDEIKQTQNRRRELGQKKHEILRETSEEEFKMNYMHRREELDALRGEIKGIPPLRFEESKEIEKEIREVEKKIKKVTDEKVENEKQRERWIGETADYTRTNEEKADKALEYGKILGAMKGHISEIAALKLLDTIIEEEKAKAQQEVFKPLQESVVSAFGALVGDRYRIGIDNDLNLAIEGKIITGGYQPGVGQALSFGTKEQLSFLFRMAIAKVLSRREPGVMVLDDSFVNTDKDRLPRLLNMLNEESVDLQFLVFTCRPSDYITNFPTWNSRDHRYINLEDLIKPAI